MVSILLRKGKVSQDFRYYFFYLFQAAYFSMGSKENFLFKSVQKLFCEKFGGNRHFCLPYIFSKFLYLLSSR